MEAFNNLLNFSIGTVTVQTLLFAVILIAIGIACSQIVIHIIKKTLARTTLDKSFHSVILLIARVLLFTLIVLIVADHLGIPVTSLVAVLSIVGLAVSLAIQDTLANVFAGIILMAAKTFSSDDYVQLAGLEGTVIRVDLMNTHLRTADGKAVRIPNKDVQTAAIVNYSREPHRRIEVAVTASYDDATETVKAALLAAAAKTPLILTDPAPVAGLRAYQSSSIEYVLWAWCNSNQYWASFFALNEAVREEFTAHGVTMTYDHLNVHIDH